MTFDLPNTDLTGQLIGCWTVALQRKGTLQRRLATGPHLREGEFLHQKRKEWKFQYQPMGSICVSSPTPYCYSAVGVTEANLLSVMSLTALPEHSLVWKKQGLLWVWFG